MSTCPLPKDLATCRNPGDYEHTGQEWTVHVEAPKLLPAVQKLGDLGFHLEDVLGMDLKEGFEVVYHFDHFRTPGRVTLRVFLARDDARIASIAAIFPGAEWHERETTDFYGIEFTDSPNPSALLLAEEYEGHPLCKADGKHVSVYKLFPTYDMVDCRPDFLEEPEAEDGEGGA